MARDNAEAVRPDRNGGIRAEEKGQSNIVFTPLPSPVDADDSLDHDEIRSSGNGIFHPSDKLRCTRYHVHLLFI